MHQGVTWLNPCVRNSPGDCEEDGLNRCKTGGKETNKPLLRTWIRAVVEGDSVRSPPAVRNASRALNGNGSYGEGRVEHNSKSKSWCLNKQESTNVK